MRFIVLCFLLAPLAACPSLLGDDDDSAATDVTLTVQNDSGIAVDSITYWDCGADSADALEVPLEPGGLVVGASISWDLGASGCWNVGAEGGGCYISGSTGDMVEGESYTWTLLPDDLLCVGG